MGVMFFVDVERSLAEVRRALRRGGRTAFAAEALETLRSLYDGSAVQTRGAVVIASATA